MSNKGGWIKLYRELLDKPIWFESTPEQKVILVTLLLMANHDGRQWEWQGQQYYAGPGQFVTSLAKIAEKAGPGISTQNVRTAIKRFEKFNFLTNQSTKVNRLITIVNWGIYQENPNEPNKVSNSQLTKSQQRANKELTTNKNVRSKECKNIDVVVEGEAISLATIYRFWESNGFGMLAPKTREDLAYWVEDFKKIGSTESQALEIVKEALIVALNANARRYNYVNAILKNWESQRATTLADVKALNKKHEVQNQPKIVRQPIRQEVIPEWLKNPKVETADAEKTAATQKALEALIKKGS